MKPICIIAKSTFLENYRNNVFQILLVSLFGLLWVSLPVSYLMEGERVRFLSNLLMGISRSLPTLWVFFLGSALINTEVKNKTLHSVIAKKVSRTEWLLGRLFGSLFIVCLLLIFAYLESSLVYFYAFRTVPLFLLDDFLFSVMSLTLLTCVSFFFSCFLGVVFSTMVAIGIYLIGFFANDLRALMANMGTAVQVLKEPVYWALPHFSDFDTRSEFLYNISIPNEKFYYCFLYLLAYCGALVAICCWRFQLRDIK